MMTEDEVREEAGKILGLKKEKDLKSGVGQITTFNQLGFKGVNDKPDGWYLPDDHNMPAIILETKSEAEDITLQKWVDELFVNIDIVNSKYKEVVGILYNGKEQRVFLNKDELIKIPKELQRSK